MDKFNYQALTLKKDNLILRQAEISDAQDMFNNWASDCEVLKYLNWQAHENIGASKLILRLWTDKTSSTPNINWICVDNRTKVAIGSAHLSMYDEVKLIAELGFCLGRPFWGQGYGTKILSLLIEHAFNIGFKTVICHTRSENEAAKRVFLKNKLQYKKSEKYFWSKEQKYYYIETYSLDKKTINSGENINEKK